MIEDLIKCQKTSGTCYQFTVLIPSCNNLGFLRMCIESLRRNSYYDLQIVVIINEGSDGTIEWIQAQNEIDYIFSRENIGISYGLNIARSLIKSDYVIFLKDDMYVLPGWDRELYSEIESIGRKDFLLSCTLIEPDDTGDPCVVVKNYGSGFKDFDEPGLLHDYKELVINDWSGTTSQATVVHIDIWDLVGGMSVGSIHGKHSESDFSGKLVHAGVKIFKGKGSSLVYHFGSGSLRNIKLKEDKSKILPEWILAGSHKLASALSRLRKVLSLLIL